MLAGTLVYVNAGTQLARIDSPAGILSPALIGVFVLLGLFPLRRQESRRRRRRRAASTRAGRARRVRAQPGGDRRRLGGPGLGLHRRGGERQGHADREAPHGRRLPQHRLRAVQGADPLGASCCRRSGERSDFGIASASAEFDFAEVMERVQRVIQADRAARFGRALHRARRRVHPGRGEDHLALDGRGPTTASARSPRAPSSSPPGRGPFVPPIPGIERDRRA